MSGFMSNLKNMAGGGSSHHSQAPQTGAGQDPMDKKAKEFLQKSGAPSFVSSNNTVEKITDTGRGMFEKATGKTVPSKYSN
ncbi:hypothetical protein F5Y15DRAFT_366315 [Xylariaceae sp. FL0016]|nr:hypothetical protein F5Y15DRAFT_366315 [Xylariaceae sp. FL0016]